MSLNSLHSPASSWRQCSPHMSCQHIRPQLASPLKPKPMTHSPKAQKPCFAKLLLENTFTLEMCTVPRFPFNRVFPSHINPSPQFSLSAASQVHILDIGDLLPTKPEMSLPPTTFRRLVLGLQRTTFWSNHLHMGLCVSKLVQLISPQPHYPLLLCASSFVWILFWPLLQAVTDYPSCYQSWILDWHILHCLSQD